MPSESADVLARCEIAASSTRYETEHSVSQYALTRFDWAFLDVRTVQAQLYSFSAILLLHLEAWGTEAHTYSAQAYLELHYVKRGWV